MSGTYSAVGRLTRDPELREVGDPKVPNCKFGLAVNTGFGTKEKSMFFDVVTWRGLATNANKFLKKGSKVFISGSLEQNSWEKDGVKHSSVVINADTVDFLDPAPKKEVESETQDTESEVPF